jgi:integrase
MGKKRHNKDKKLHNFDEKLHNSDAVNNEPDLSWQERVDLKPEDEAESGSEIYYFTDEDGNIHSREFIAEELIPDDVEDLDDSLKEKPRPEKVQRLKPGAVEIVNLVPASGQTQGEISLPVPKSGAPPLDVRISSEVVPDLFIKKEAQSDGVEKYRQVIVTLEDRSAAAEATHTVDDLNDHTPLVLNFKQAELESYVTYRSEGLAQKSKDWITRSSEAVWESTRGEISHQTMTRLRTFVLEKYNSADSHSKVLSFAVGFLNFLAQTNIDPRYVSFKLFLERPKTKKVKKALTERIITREDIGAVFQRIAAAEEGGTDPSKIRNYRAFVLLASYTGLRPSTLERLTVGQFRTALREEKPVLHVLAEQEKNRIEHYVPLHPSVIGAVREVLKHDFGQNDDTKLFFMFNSFQNWIERQRIPLKRVRDPSKARMWLSDFRKFAEQFGDVIGWDATNRKYVLAHGMTGVDWEHYKHPLPEDVYDTYMRYWRDVKITS